MSISVLKKQIEEGRLKNLYLFYGPEDYLKKYYLNCIEKKLVSRELSAVNKIVHEGKVSAKALYDSCETFPLFSEKKLVIVKHSGLFNSKKGADSEEILGLLQNVTSHTCLVFYEDEIDKRMKTVKAVKEKGMLVEFDFRKPAELVKWVIKVFKSHNIDIDTAAASWLVENSEQGMGYIMNEINKIVMYLSGRKKVEQSDIEKVCSRSVKTRVFDLTDAIAGKDCERALKLLNDMIESREPVNVILYMIARQFRHILQMKLMSAEGASVDEAALKIGITPYAARKVLKQSQGFTVDDLKKALERCLDMDVGIKSGKIDERTAAELLIVEVAGA